MSNGYQSRRTKNESDHEKRAEEFKHFGMDLEFLLRRKPIWRAELKEILFTEVTRGKAGEKSADCSAEANWRQHQAGLGGFNGRDERCAGDATKRILA